MSYLKAFKEGMSDLKAFKDCVNFHELRLGVFGTIVLSVKSAQAILANINALEEENRRLVIDKSVLKSTLATLEGDLANKEDALDAKQRELDDLREQFDMLTAEEPVVDEHATLLSDLEKKVHQLNWRVTKLEHGIGGHVYHLTREGA